MAEYIEREALRQQIERYVKLAKLTNREEAEWVKDECIRMSYVIPTADVVQRAEVEKQIGKIFAEIEKIMEDYFDAPLCNYQKVRIAYAKFKKKYAEEGK